MACARSGPRAKQLAETTWRSRTAASCSTSLASCAMPSTCTAFGRRHRRDRDTVPATEPTSSQAERNLRWRRAGELGLHSHRTGGETADRPGRSRLARRNEEVAKKAPPVTNITGKASITNSTTKNRSTSKWYGFWRARWPEKLFTKLGEPRAPVRR
jgi:hypothetical protein